MIRRTRPPARPLPEAFGIAESREQLLGRRRFLIQAAGGSVALLFGIPRTTRAAEPAYDPWPTLEAVLQQLLPSSSEGPGAADINALGYLRFVIQDPKVDRQEREFILQGNRWLDDLAQQEHRQRFAELEIPARESLLRRIAASAAGENWLATLLTYLFEALLSAPAYGGNPDGIGWRWLEYVPGYPLPTVGNRYPELPL